MKNPLRAIAVVLALVGFAVCERNMYLNSARIQKLGETNEKAKTWTAYTPENHPFKDLT